MSWRMIRERKPGADIRCQGDPLPFPSDASDQPLRDAIGDYPQWTFARGLDETMSMFESLVAAGNCRKKTPPSLKILELNRKRRTQ